jgi:intracellular septation protein A
MTAPSTGPDRSVPAGGLAAAVGEQFSLQAATGGVRGMVESVLPIAVFSVVYAVTRQLWASVIASVAVAVLAVLARLIARQPVSQAVSGLFGVALGAVLALYTGRAVNFFAVSIVKNLGLLVLYAASMALRWPFVGVILGFALGEGTHWRQVRPRMRAYQLATAIWVGMCVVRLAFQIPLYVKDHATELGAASVPLGLPLFGLVLLLTWLVVRRVPVARPPEDLAAAEPAAAAPAAVAPAAVEPAE